MLKTKFLKIKLLKITDLHLIVISAFFLGIFYNFKIIAPEFSTSFVTFFCEILVSISISILFFLSLSFSKILLKIFLSLIFLCSTIYLYVLNKFGIILDGSMISNGLNSVGHVNEVTEYSLIFSFLFFAILPIFLIWRAQFSKINYAKKNIAAALCSAFLIAAHISFLPDEILKSSATKYSPVNYFEALIDYFQRFHGQLRAVENRTDLTNFYKFKRDKKSNNLNIVLIIGESLRADHLGLNGYKRNTTPNLLKKKGFLNFTVEPSFNITTSSVTSMLSHRTKSNFIAIPPEKSIVSLLGQMGFKTHWYSAQSSKEFGNGMLTIMAMEADDYFFRDHLKSVNRSNKIYDEALLPHLKEVIAANKGNNFVVLHTFGSHIRTHERYPESFKIFSPQCEKIASSCPKDQVINAYDNSVLYTDHFISQAIELLKDTDSIIFFVSDHGIFLGENGVYANGNSSQIKNPFNKVPMFFYMTPSLRKNAAYQKKFMAAKSKIASSELSHDNLFDSILSCSGIDSDLLDRNLSICR